MSEIVDDVARVLVPGDWNIVPENKRSHWRSEANAVITAATPHIRAALFDELIAASEADLDERFDYLEGENERGVIDSLEQRTEWLRAMKENTQP